MLTSYNAKGPDTCWQSFRYTNLESFIDCEGLCRGDVEPYRDAPQETSRCRGLKSRQGGFRYWEDRPPIKDVCHDSSVLASD